MIKNKISILVVDDELDICEMVAETLKDEDYNAIVATNYDMAVDILKNKNINLSLSKILPSLNIEKNLNYNSKSMKNSN